MDAPFLNDIQMQKHVIHNKVVCDTNYTENQQKMFLNKQDMIQTKAIKVWYSTYCQEKQRNKNKTSCKSPYNFKKEYAYFGDWYVYFF